MHWYTWITSGANASSVEDKYGILSSPPSGPWRFKPEFFALSSLQG